MRSSTGCHLGVSFDYLHLTGHIIPVRMRRRYAVAVVAWTSSRSTSASAGLARNVAKIARAVCNGARASASWPTESRQRPCPSAL